MACGMKACKPPPRRIESDRYLASQDEGLGHVGWILDLSEHAGLLDGRVAQDTKQLVRIFEPRRWQ